MALFAGMGPLVVTRLQQRQHWPWATPLDALIFGLRSSRPVLR
jgi:hypothetical protein